MFTKCYCALGYRCNNNCLICVVDAHSNRNKNMTKKEVLDFFNNRLEKNKDIGLIELSGGEPTVREDFLYILSYLGQKYPYLHYSLLTNGRRFCNFAFAGEFSGYNIRSVITALHHWKEEKHDELTQVKGSFRETHQGIKNLSQLNVPVTVKIIVTKLNYKDMPQIVEFVAKNFPSVKNMSINGLDIRGMALASKDKVAVSFTDYIPYVYKAIDIANKYNINMVLYSIPLCVLSKEYRNYAGQQPDTVSLYRSPSKEVQNKTDEHGAAPECYSCDLNKKCYGTWSSYYDAFGTGELKQEKKENKKTIVFDVCGACNNDCLFCSENGNNPSNDKTPEKIKEKIDLLKLRKQDSIVLMGGEPTIFKDIIPLIKHIKKYTDNVSITTNGRKLKDDIFAKNIIQAGITRFCIDIHGHNAELHDKITQRKGSFNETLNGIENLVNNNCAIIIKIVMHKMNYIYLKDIVDFLHTRFSGKTSIIFSFLSINGSAIRNKKILSIKAGKVAPYMDSAINFAKSKKINCQVDMFPICVLKNYKNINSLRQKRMPLYDRESQEAANNNICKTCSFYRTKCDGVWSNYIKEYGIGEFNPRQ